MIGLMGRMGSGAKKGLIQVKPMAKVMNIHGNNRLQNSDFQSRDA